MSEMRYMFTRLIRVTERLERAAWKGVPGGALFKCSLCGHRFRAGDKFRGVMCNTKESPYRGGNLLVCEECHNEYDGDDVKIQERRIELEDVDDLDDLDDDDDFEEIEDDSDF